MIRCCSWFPFLLSSFLITSVISWDISLKFEKYFSGAVGGEAFIDQPIIGVYNKKGETKNVNLVGRILATIDESPSGSQELGIFEAGKCDGGRDKRSLSVDLLFGEAAFSNLCINRTGHDYKIRYVLLDEFDIILGQIVGVAFFVEVGVPYQINLIRRPAEAYGGLPWKVQPIVAVQDKGFNTVDTVNIGIVSVIHGFIFPLF